MPVTFSVITPSYNSKQYIAEAIESVMMQRGDFYIDYVVVDGSSTDGTIDILEKYRQLNEKGILCNCLGMRFQYITEPDKGMYDALSKAMKICQGDIVSYINSDDFYLPNAFSTVASVFKDNDVAWLTGLPGRYNKHGAIIPARIPCVFNAKYIRSGVYGTYLPHIQQESTFWRRELCGELSFDKLAKFKYAGDYYLWNTFAKTNELYTVNAQLSGFREHADNMSLDINAYNSEFNSITDDRLGIVDYPRILIYMILFKLFGNKILRYYSNVISVH